MEQNNGSNGVSRREFLVLGGTSLIALIAAGCGAGTTTTQAPAQAPAAPAGAGAAAKAPAKASGTVEFLAWGDTSDVPAWERLSKEYATKNPNVQLKVTTVADPNANFYPKLQTSIAGGTPPDIASFQGWEWQTYADKNILTPIDDLIARDNFKDPWPSDWPLVKESTQRKDKTYLIPLQVATMVMFYAKKPFEEAGLAMPKDDWTFEQFLEMAQKLTNTGGAAKKFGYQPNNQWFRDIGWILGTGKREFDSVIDPKKAQFNTPEIVKLVQTVAYDVIHTMKVSPTAADAAGGANTIQTGNCAMKYEGPWFLPQLNSPQLREQKKEVPFDVVLMPKTSTDPKRVHRGWAEGIALPKAKNTEGAWDVVKYMAGEEGDKIYSEITGRIPNSPKLIESFWLPTIKERFGVQNGKAFTEALKSTQIDVVSGVPRSKMWSEVVKPVGWDPMLNASGKAADVMPKVDQQLQGLLDEYWKTQ